MNGRDDLKESNPLQNFHKYMQITIADLKSHNNIWIKEKVTKQNRLRGVWLSLGLYHAIVTIVTERVSCVKPWYKHSDNIE